MASLSSPPTSTTMFSRRDSPRQSQGNILTPATFNHHRRRNVSCYAAHGIADLPPWINSKPVGPVPTKRRQRVAASSSAPHVTATAFPVTLDKVVRVEVRRPRKNRTKEEKELEEEILLIEGIEVDANQYAKFDVYLNDDGENDPDGRYDKAEFAGSFAHLPYRQKNVQKTRTSLSLGLNEAMEVLGAEDDDTILVTLAPNLGDGVVTIDSIKIVYGS